MSKFTENEMNELRASVVWLRNVKRNKDRAATPEALAAWQHTMAYCLLTDMDIILSALERVISE